MTTIITCPKCQKATHTASTVGDKSLSDSQRFLTLTCQSCSTQLIFVVEMLPEFDRIVESISCEC